MSRKEKRRQEKYDDVKNMIKSWSKAKKSKRLKYAKWINTMKSTMSRYWGKEIPRINEKVEKLHTKFVKYREEVKVNCSKRKRKNRPEPWPKALDPAERDSKLIPLL